jgi:hypothetical protein
MECENVLPVLWRCHDSDSEHEWVKLEATHGHELGAVLLCLVVELRAIADSEDLADVQYYQVFWSF